MRISDWSSDVCSSDLNDGWFDTGDLARIDARGNVTITGRAKDLIKSGGEWINPAEIEAIIAALPQVALVAVIGRADPKWGERPLLVVGTRSEQGRVGKAGVRTCRITGGAAYNTIKH